MHKSVRFFRKNIVEARFASIIASLSVLVMRMAMFSTYKMPALETNDAGFLWNYIAPFFSNPLYSFIASTLVVFAIAWLMSQLNDTFSLIRSRTCLPFVVPLLLFSAHPYFMVMTPDLVATLIISLALFPMLQSYHKSAAQIFSFRISIIIGIASVFQLYMLLLLPLWWRGESSMRGFQFRSILASLFGILLTYLPVFTLFFFFENLSGFVQPFMKIIHFSLPNFTAFTPLEWITATSTFLFFILIMFFSMKAYKRDKVLTLNALQFTLFLLLFLLVFRILYWNHSSSFMTISLPFLSFLIAYLYTLTTNRMHVYSAYFVFFMIIAFYMTNYLSV